MEYDLEQRTLQFAKNTRLFIKKIPKTVTNFDDLKQLVRSSGSIGANYIEANGSLSKKDFVMRVKICRKEAKETIFWLKLIETKKPSHNQERVNLIQEATELMKILGAILQKCQ